MGSLKQFVKEITKYDHDAYKTFWQLETCQQLLEELNELGDVSWVSQAGHITADKFTEQFNGYLKKVCDDLVTSGISSSWFKCYDNLCKGDNVVILNSFGVDTRKVILATVPDERQVMQITVNYDLWDERDVKKFEA